MKFLCVCYYDAAAFAKFTPADFEKMGAICCSARRRIQGIGQGSPYRLARHA